MYLELAQILSVDTKNIDGSQGSTPYPLRELTMLPQTPGHKGPGFQ